MMLRVKIELSRIFGVTIDVLLKDELTVDGVKEKKSCGESLANENDGVKVYFVI